MSEKVWEIKNTKRTRYSGPAERSTRPGAPDFPTGVSPQPRRRGFMEPRPEKSGDAFVEAAKNATESEPAGEDLTGASVRAKASIAHDPLVPVGKISALTGNQVTAFVPASKIATGVETVAAAASFKSTHDEEHAATAKAEPEDTKTAEVLSEVSQRKAMRDEQKSKSVKARDIMKDLVTEYSASKQIELEKALAALSAAEKEQKRFKNRTR